MHLPPRFPKLRYRLRFRLTKAMQVREAMRFVPDELVLDITATGTPSEAKARVQEYVERGCTCPVLYPLGDPLLMMDTFASP